MVIQYVLDGMSTYMAKCKHYGQIANIYVKVQDMERAATGYLPLPANLCSSNADLMLGQHIRHLIPHHHRLNVSWLLVSAASQLLSLDYFRHSFRPRDYTFLPLLTQLPASH